MTFIWLQEVLLLEHQESAPKYCTLQRKLSHLFLHPFPEGESSRALWMQWLVEAVWPSGWSARLVIRKPQLQVPPWLLAAFVLCSPEFKSSATLVNSQLVCLLPVGILKHIMFYLNYCFIIPEKPHKESS